MGVTHELILVDDRCPRGSWAVICQLAREYPHILGVRLSRNFGQHAAIGAGLSHVRGQWVVVMDCDLQDQPEEVPRLLQAAHDGNFDIVRACRGARNDPWHRRFVSRVFYRVLSFLTGTHQSAEIANFGVYRRKVVDVIRSWDEESKYFPAIVEWVGFASEQLEVSHSTRHSGSSSYTMSKLLRLATNVIVGFSEKPLTLLMISGLLLAMTSFVAATIVLAMRILGMVSVEGWTSVMLSLWFLSGCILFALGLTGLYVGRILVEAKGRPPFVIDELRGRTYGCRAEGRRERARWLSFVRQG